MLINMKSNYLGLRFDLNVIFPEFSVNSTPCEWREAMLIKNGKEVKLPSYLTMIRLCAIDLETGLIALIHPCHLNSLEDFFIR